MRMSSQGTIVLILLPMLGCTLHRVDENVALPSFTPDTFTQSGTIQSPDRWWEAFEDPELNGLVARALAENLDLRGAWARLKQAEAVARQSAALRLPRVDASAGGRRFRGTSANREFTASAYDLGLSVAYEVDLWQRLSSLEKAGHLDALASREDAEAIALSLAAIVARTWMALLAQREQLTLLAQQIETSQVFLEIIEIRFSNAAASAVEVYQQREQLASVRAQVPVAQAQMALLEHQLAVLLGASPTEKVAGPRAKLPQLPDLPKTGIPAALVQNRPDIRRALHGVRAADYRIAAAIADRYPSLGFSASSGFQAERIGDLFGNWIWSLAASIAGSVFDGGAKKAEVYRSKAVLEERLINYERGVLTAFQEVEDALTREHYQRELLVRLETQLDLARSALASAKSRFHSGVGGFLTVLTETQAVQRIERSLITGRLDLIENRIALCQALGGSWTTSLKAPAGDGK